MPCIDGFNFSVNIRALCLLLVEVVIEQVVKII